jgi:hypothetical protein
MAHCECGCHEEAGTSQFLTGHDQKLRISLEQEVGGILSLRTLVEAAHSYSDGGNTEEKFTQTVRAIFASAPRSKGK